MPERASNPRLVTSPRRQVQPGNDPISSLGKPSIMLRSRLNAGRSGQPTRIPMRRCSILQLAFPDLKAKLCPPRAEEHTSELQYLMRMSDAVCCLKQTQSPNSHTRKVPPHP